MSYDNTPGGVPLKIDQNPTTHPSMVQGDGPSASSARLALRDLYTSLSTIIALGKTANIEKAQIAAQVQPYAEKAVSRAGTSIDVIGTQIKQLNTEIHAAVVAGKGRGHGPEIRAHFAKKKSMELMHLGKVFQNAADNIEVVSEIAGAPPFLSGLDQKKMDVLIPLAQKSLTPEKVALRDESMKALDQLNKATTDFTDKTTAMLRGWQDKSASVIAEALNPKETEQ